MHKTNSQGISRLQASSHNTHFEELPAKIALAAKLNEIIEMRGLSQIEAATITGMTQPKVSQIRRSNLRNISLERLMQALVSLDQHVEIIVQPTHYSHERGISVVAR